jgi:hypothetical protein
MKMYVELEVERHASFIIVDQSDHVPDILPPRNDTPVRSGQTDVGFQN